jgi:TonB family protein
MIVISLTGIGCQPDATVMKRSPSKPEQTASSIPTVTPAPDSHPEGSAEDDETPPEGGEDYTPPEPLETPLPPLSEVAKGCKRFDTPYVEFTIRKDGKTEGHRFLQNTGCETADEIVMEYVKRWTFKPATVNGEPVADEHITAVHW